MAHPVTLRPAPAAPGAATAVLALGVSLSAALIAAVLPGWSGLLSLVWPVLVALAWRSPLAGIAVLALAVPFEQRVAIPTIAGDVTAMGYTGWALVAGTLPRLARECRVVIDRVAVTHLAIVVALVASFAAGGVRALTWWQEVRIWLLAALVYVIVRSLALAPRQAGAVVSALAAGVILNALMSGWQLATGAGPASYVVGGAVRVFGTFMHPNTLASYLVFILPMLLAVSLAPRWRGVWIARLGAMAGLVTLVLTQSRGGLLAFAVAAAALVALAPRAIQRRAVAAALAVALILLAGGMVVAIPGLERFSTTVPDGGSIQVTPATWGQLEREAHWGAAWSMLESDPLFGVGAGEFNDNYREHTPEWRFRVGRGHAHNAYLQLGAEAGVPGLVACVAWVGTIVVALWRRALHTSGIDYLLAAGALGTALAWTVDGVFEYQDVPSILIVFVLLIALGSRDESPVAGRSRAGDIGSTGAAM